jgi:hypothetical protein
MANRSALAARRKPMKSIRSALTASTLLLLAAALLPVNPLDAQGIQADGMIESTAGGFKFPDGSVQTMAAGHYERLLLA